MTSDRPEDIPKHLQQELLKNIQVQGNLPLGTSPRLVVSLSSISISLPNPQAFLKIFPAAAFLSLSDGKKHSQHYTSSCSTGSVLQFLRSLVLRLQHKAFDQQDWKISSNVKAV